MPYINNLLPTIPPFYKLSLPPLYLERTISQNKYEKRSICSIWEEQGCQKKQKILNGSSNFDKNNRPSYEGYNWHAGGDIKFVGEFGWWGWNSIIILEIMF